MTEAKGMTEGNGWPVLKAGATVVGSIIKKGANR